MTSTRGSCFLTHNGSSSGGGGTLSRHSAATFETTFEMIIPCPSPPFRKKTADHIFIISFLTCGLLFSSMGNAYTVCRKATGNCVQCHRKYSLQAQAGDTSLLQMQLRTKLVAASASAASFIKTAWNEPFLREVALA